MRLRYNQNYQWCGWEGNQNFLKARNKLVAHLLARFLITHAGYPSGNIKVILQLKRVSMVNSHWLYPSLMTYMLDKLLLKEKGKY